MRAMMKACSALCVSAALFGVATTTATAAEVAGRAPYAAAAFGQQSDASGPAYTQAFTAPGGAMLEAIRWWGFHSSASMGASFDNFVVMLDGVAQTGTLTINSLSPFFDEYTLDIADVLLTASTLRTLSVANDSLDVEWFWQSAIAPGAGGGPDPSDVAFSLIGTPLVTAVAEPGTAWLALAAALTMWLGVPLRRARCLVLSALP